MTFPLSVEAEYSPYGPGGYLWVPVKNHVQVLGGWILATNQIILQITKNILRKINLLK